MLGRGSGLLAARAALFLDSARQLSASEAAVALRPFYFAVHPDRFALNPQAREQNEKSLQIFNGYLNDLFTSPPQNQIEVKFAIAGKKKGEFEQIVLCLTGRDPNHFVRHALEKAKLSTSTLPKSRILPERRAWSLPQTSKWTETEDDPMAIFWRRRRQAQRADSNDLGALLREKRDLAIEKAKMAEEMRMTLADEIEDVKWRTGATHVVWQIDWAESHMRRCLTMINRMLDLASSELRTTIVQALYMYKLRLGRGSFVCCDGALQFGADNVPEQWEQVCLEASVRRTQIPVLKETRAALSALLGNATILAPDHLNLGKTLQEMQTLIVRIRTNDNPEIMEKISQLGASTVIEVMSAYDELAVGGDGRLLVPCTVALPYLLDFLQMSAEQSRRANQNTKKLNRELEELKTDAIRRHALSGLTWDGEGVLSGDALSASLKRLTQLPVQEAMKSLHLHISANPHAHVMNDGRISIPLEWKFT